MNDYIGIVVIYAVWELLWFIGSDLAKDGEYMRPPMGVLNYIRRRRWDSV